MLQMFDGIDVADWPEGVTYGLVYTDGRYANEAAARARFPDATFQTISATGATPADWIDCEPGCVYPPSAAAELFRSWEPKGCRGIYCRESDLFGVQMACRSIGVNPEYFDAHWTNTEHIDPGATETQYESTPGYDISAIPDPPAPAPAPAPTPTPTPTGEDMPTPCVFTTPDHNQQVFWVDSTGTLRHQYWTAPGGPWSPIEVVAEGFQPNAQVTQGIDSIGTIQVWALNAEDVPAQAYWSGSAWVPLVPSA